MHFARNAVWVISLSVAMRAFGRLYEAYGNAENLTLGYRGRLTLTHAGEFRIYYFDPVDGGDDDGDIGLYSARRWIEGEVEDDGFENKE
jgi:hypothetical protein